MTYSNPHPVDLDVEARRHEERKIWRNALIFSLLVHALVFLLWGRRPVPLSPFAAAGPRAGDARAAAGSMQAMTVRTPVTPQVVPPPVPVPTLEEVEPIEFEDEVVLEDPSIAGAGDGLEGPGLEDGTGEGDGGTSDEGLFRMVPPTPRGMILPHFNKKLEGEEVVVWVFVNEQGKVVPDSTFLRPPTSDGDYNRRLIVEAADWMFVPARKGGRPVATWFPYTITGGL